MIELTDDQVRLLSEPQSGPPRLFNPRTNEAFVLLGIDEYKHLIEDAYDDSSWTRDEIEAAAAQVADRAGWDGVDGDDDETTGPR